MRKSRVTRELVNYFPGWSRIRNEDQSVGYQYLNALAQPLDDMDHYLERMRSNQYLSTINLDEIDWTYYIQLPATYEFSYDSGDPLEYKYEAPTVQGLVVNNTHTGYVNVSLAERNDIDSLWYDAIPTRLDLEETVAGTTENLLSRTVENFPYSGLLTHHLGGGKIWIKASGGSSYVGINENNEIERGKVVLSGITRKGTVETETIVFPWDEKQPTLKEWKEIYTVNVFDMEDEVTIDIRSGQFAWGPYWAFYNLRWSDMDTKIDEFWDLGSLDSGSTLDRVGFVSDEWQNLLLGFSEKVVKDRWELLDESWSPISATDLAVQPFTEKAWVVSSDKHLYCYSIEETMASGVNFIAQSTDGSNVRFEVEEDYFVSGEDIAITPLHVRPLQQIDKYRIWYQTPSGSKYGLLAGAQVSFSSDFWSYPTIMQRQIEPQIDIEATERGEYLFALEAVFPDGTTHFDRVAVPIQYKLPLTSVDLSSYIDSGETIVGVDFDSDQQLWVKTNVKYYRFSLHADLMLIDYNDKVVYFRENYQSVDIE